MVNDGFPYRSNINDKSGVAKTGTSAAAMTLGGMLNTKPQRMYFMYNVHPIKFTGVRKRTSRAMIGEEVRKLSRQFADSFIEVEYKKVSFASFEPDSFQETLKLAKLP